MKKLNITLTIGLLITSLVLTSCSEKKSELPQVTNQGNPPQIPASNPTVPQGNPGATIDPLESDKKKAIELDQLIKKLSEEFSQNLSDMFKLKIGLNSRGSILDYLEQVSTDELYYYRLENDVDFAWIIGELTKILDTGSKQDSKIKKHYSSTTNWILSNCEQYLARNTLLTFLHLRTSTYLDFCKNWELFVFRADNLSNDIFSLQYKVLGNKTFSADLCEMTYSVLAKKESLYFNSDARDYVKFSTLALFRGLPNLKSITIENRLDGVAPKLDISDLGKIPYLESFDGLKLDIEASNLKHVHSNFKKLSLFSSNINSLVWLGNTPNLRIVELNFVSRRRSNGTYGSFDFSPLKKAIYLEELDVYKVPIENCPTDSDVVVLNNFCSDYLNQ